MTANTLDQDTSQSSRLHVDTYQTNESQHIECKRKRRRVAIGRPWTGVWKTGMPSRHASSNDLIWSATFVARANTSVMVIL